MSIWLRALRRIAFTVLVGGLLSATLARYAPGFGSDEDQLDTHRGARQREQAQVGSDVLSFYLSSLGGYLRGEFGVSRSLHRPVRDLLRERVRPTAIATLTGLCGAWILGLGAALLASFRNTALVRGGLGAGMSLLQCLPAAVIALFLVALGGRGALLGGSAVTLVLAPRVVVYTGNILGQACRSPHILVARARGLSRMRVLLRHAIPVSLPELVSFAGISVSMALSAAIPVEVILDIPGIGQLAWQAALARDMALLLAITMMLSTAVVVSNTFAEYLVRPPGPPKERT
jgi:peptide/nickel transport system permease protein